MSAQGPFSSAETSLYDRILARTAESRGLFEQLDVPAKHRLKAYQELKKLKDTEEKLVKKISAADAREQALMEKDKAVTAQYSVQFAATQTATASSAPSSSNTKKL